MKKRIFSLIRDFLILADHALAWPVCPFCRNTPLPSGDYCCGECRKALDTFGDRKRCPGCGGINTGFLDVCQECCRHGDWPWFRAVSAFPYQGLIRDAMIQYKYKGKTCFLPFFAQAMAEAWELHGPPAHPDFVTAVPMHWYRRLQRGYNQAELLARQVAKILGIPYIPALRRSRFTPRQAKLNKDQRLKNLSGAFRSLHEKKYQGRTVLLIDDVFTTGSTLKECSRVLLKAGAGEIDVLTVARDE